MKFKEHHGSLSKENRKIIGQGVILFGLSMTIFGIYLLSIGFEWPLGGRERTIDIVLLALFGPQYAPLAMSAFFVGFGFLVVYKGLEMRRKDA
jgi:hypothetical protein